MKLLEVKNATMRFGGLTAVSNFNLSLHKNEIVGLIGPNGAGKTTAFNMITGIYKPTEGEVYFKNNKISGLKPDKITQLGIARTFQNIRLFSELPVLDNVMIGMHLRLKSNFLNAILRTPGYLKEEKNIRNKSIQLLDTLGLYNVRNEKAASLPYGQQRRLEIARALATEPEVLLLDEPAAGMNPQESIELMEFIKKIRDEFDLTIFMIEHHMKVVMGICERIIVLDHGETIAEGNPQEIQNNEKVVEAYLGVELDA